MQWILLRAVCGAKPTSIGYSARQCFKFGCSGQKQILQHHNNGKSLQPRLLESAEPIKLSEAETLDDSLVA